MIKKIIGCMLLAAAAGMASSAVYADVNTCYIDTNKNGSWDSGENYYTSLTDAVKAASSGSVIRMVADETTASESIEINNTITIDGDGHTYTSKKNAFIDASNANLTLYNINLNNCGWNTIYFTAGGTLEINNSTIDNSQGTAVYCNTGNLALSDVTISNCQQSGDSCSAVFISNTDTASIYNCNIIGSKYKGIVNEGNSNLTITKSYISNNGDTGFDNKGSGIVKVENTAFTLNAKGGVRNNNNGKMYLTDCSIDRNRIRTSDSNEFGGGGFLNGTNGLMILDRCSITDNLISDSFKGGGGGENNGTLYMNNCTVANNQTHELGGGLNNSGTAYILNSTFTGNSSLCTASDRSAGANNGGAIGVFSEGKVYAVNTLFSVNYCMDLSTKKPIPSDIGVYSGNTNTTGTNSNVHVYNCIYNTIAENNNDTSTFADIDSCNSISSGRDIFNTFATGYILNLDGSFNYDTSFERPALTLTENNNTYAALLKTDSKALTGGCTTYFDIYELDNNKIIAGYLKNGQFSSLNGMVLYNGDVVSEESAAASIKETLETTDETVDESEENTETDTTEDVQEESDEDTVTADTTEDDQEEPIYESNEEITETDTADITAAEVYITLYDRTAYDIYKVGKYQNEVTRVVGVVGAIGPEEETKTYYTITVKGLENGSVNGASIYGDTHESGSFITIEAIPNEGYNFKQWKIVKYTTDDNGSREEAFTTYINLSEYTITLDANYDVSPVFEPGYTVTFSADPDSGYYTANGTSKVDNETTGIIAFNITASIDTVATSATITEFGMDLSTDINISIDAVGSRIKSSNQSFEFTFSQNTTFQFNATVDEIPYNSFGTSVYCRPYIVIAGTASDTNNSVENDDDSSDSNSTVSSTNNDGTYTAAELFHCNVDSNKWLGGDAEHEADISNTSNDTSSAK